MKLLYMLMGFIAGALFSVVLIAVAQEQIDNWLFLLQRKLDGVE